MLRRIVVLPEELEVLENRLIKIEKKLEREHKHLDDPILNTEDIMSLLKVSRRSVQAWRDQGIIEFSAIRGKFYYKMSAINKMLDNHLKKEVI